MPWRAGFVTVDACTFATGSAFVGDLAPIGRPSSGRQTPTAPGIEVRVNCGHPMQEGLVVHQRYVLERRVGSGAFAEVWRACDRATSTPVAVKLLRPPPDPAARARLAVEYRAHQRVDHPRVCAALQALEGGEGIVFELLEGPSLAAVLKRERILTIPRALEAAADALTALAAVHSARIVHRDVSPGNLVYDASRRIKLIDFGVAKIIGDEPTFDQTTTMDAALGTVAHQAPEQLDDPRSVDGRADLYGVGSVLFLALTGRTLFRGATPAVLVSLKAQCNPPTLREATGEDWPASLESLIARLVAPHPAQRIPSAEDALHAIHGTGLFEEG